MDISPSVECEYCEQNHEHGGKCDGRGYKKMNAPCLGFKRDSRGTIRYESGSRFKIKINDPVPELHKWIDDYTLGGKETPIKFTKITPLKWITDRVIAMECRIEFYYYDNSMYEAWKSEKKLAEVIPIRKIEG